MVIAHNFQVNSPNVEYTPETITSQYSYQTTSSRFENGQVIVEPKTVNYTFKTQRAVPKLGVMVVGLGGNNGTTVLAGVIANREGITWRTKSGVKQPNYFGSLTQASTLRLGSDAGEPIFIAFKSILPMVEPNDLVFGGWDINGMDMADAMERAQVLDYDLQRQLRPFMQDMKPLPSIYVPDFIASNQADRADNVLQGSKHSQMETVRQNIRDFKAANGLDKVVVIWSASTERFCDELPGVNDTADNLLQAIQKDEAEISPSVLFAVASILEGCSYINGSPQNTLVPGVVDLAMRHNVSVAGDDFKSGQTKMKSVLVDFLVSAGIKPVSIASYNHLGNNDGKNLSSAAQFRSKEISKSNVVDDMVQSNSLLYKDNEAPDHLVVIKYLPYVGDSKRALDEYTSEIFLNGVSTITLNNVCEDSLLAAPLILDLVILAELCERITYAKEGVEGFHRFHPVLSLLSYCLKAPMVPEGAPVVNALFKQRAALENVFRACVGLPAENMMSLETITVV